ncbi:hypothetical protein MAM1_0662d11087 [Mucor ambiguus]|uniref:Uncharacterized protein n=1 Tax=Mucor ambiguus TaxID=91626 RepID=A0A0C9N9T4_9FUNG|nr:hypothetical protein MAM1_0662d11087 [Mucor ambiguus]
MKKKFPRISRAKFENIAYLALNAVNMVTYLMVFAASITKAKQGRLAEIIQAIYCTQIDVLFAVMCEIAFNIIVTIIAFTIGFAYFILSLIPTLPPPNSFWVHWQNHRDFWAEGLDLTVPKIHTTPMPINNSSHLLHPCAWHPSSSKIASANSILYYQQRHEDPPLLGVYY